MPPDNFDQQSGRNFKRTPAFSDEGVIKFQLEHRQAPPLPTAEVAELTHWRSWMLARGLIGELHTPDGPIGYGNISRRAAAGFIITGSQTGGLAELGPEHYTLVRACRLENNRVYSEGPLKPSSESLTHAAVYQQDQTIYWVMHAHCAAIWEQAKEFRLPTTPKDVPYGTPQMAGEVARLFQETAVAELGIFAMGGHQDGIVSFGHTPEQAAAAIEKYLS